MSAIAGEPPVAVIVIVSVPPMQSGQKNICDTFSRLLIGPSAVAAKPPLLSDSPPALFTTNVVALQLITVNVPLFAEMNEPKMHTCWPVGIGGLKVPV